MKQQDHLPSKLLREVVASSVVVSQDMIVVLGVFAMVTAYLRIGYK